MLAFVNTHVSGGGRPELFSDGIALTRWFDEHDLPVDPGEVTDSDAARARGLRDALATLLQAHAADVDQAELAAAELHLRTNAESLPLVVLIDSETSRLHPAQTGVDGAFAAVLAAVATTTATGQWTRLKMCKNPPCHTGFVDKTKNSAGRFCSTQCGSQLTMRAYRSRLKSK
ncbi:CGNR zinc finger domain-containing protein [Nocardioides anomalus]|uniref:CGNR zinc finger domain-containing protein n=1 Tax=Nocardioides anomalus TaxID=2712223 RepID=A0A6G6W8I9_9ACTN|nr:CGNR zinc finger domain-containing protein [Nocardioides anomalus]QIG41467.1 CGNR zinc finger domain-containing protein [Nocardioides anomalus]